MLLLNITQYLKENTNLISQKMIERKKIVKEIGEDMDKLLEVMMVL